MGRNNESTSINYKELVLEYLYTYYDKDAIDYLRTITHMYGITVEEGLDLFACHEKTDENEVLIKLNICVPTPYDKKSAQIFIHEYKHGLDLFPYLGKKIENLIEDNSDKFERRAKTEEKSFNTYLVKRLSNKNIKR